MPTWFANALTAEMKRRGLNPRSLAILLGEDPSTLWRYMSEDRGPAFEKMSAIGEKLGWNFERALPDWEPEQHEEIEVVGTVAAGAIALAEEDRRSMPAVSGAWRNSLYWPHTTGPVVFLEIAGDSMEPDFHDGSFVACRRPADARKIPMLAPCVFRVAEDCTFKLFQSAGKDQVMGIPLNRSLPVMLFRADEVHVDYIVLGQLDPWRKGAKVSSRRLLMEDPSGERKSKPKSK